MTDDVFIYFVDLPNGINEAVMPCFCGYTIYIGKNLPYEEQVKAYNENRIEYKFVCKGCGQKVNRMRASAFVKHPERYQCAICHNKFERVA